MKLFSEAVTRGIGRVTLSLGKHQPTIYFAGGVTGMITCAVLACRATLKLEDTLDECRDDVDVVHYNAETRQAHAEGTVRYGRAVVSMVRLYGPSVIVGGASIAMLTQSHNLLVKRNAALTAAYAVLDKGFRDYRARVVEKYGENEDERLRYGYETVEVTREGAKNSVKVQRVGPDGASIYAVFFDQFNVNWSKDPEINKLFLRSQQNYLNNLLHARGHLFLNEVYYSLGFPHTQAGSVVGWIIHPDNDNFIDFGVFNSLADENVRDFVNGREGSVLLDFNVDGLIYDKIDANKERVSWQRSS